MNVGREYVLGVSGGINNAHPNFKCHLNGFDFCAR